jgi:hypothetical protein
MGIDEVVEVASFFGEFTDHRLKAFDFAGEMCCFHLWASKQLLNALAFRVGWNSISVQHRRKR